MSGNHMSTLTGIDRTPRPHRRGGHPARLVRQPRHRAADQISNYLPPDSGVMLHTENGMLGMGPEAHGDADRPRPGQRGQGPGDRTAGCVVLPSCRLVRDDARRPSRHLRARRLPGVGPGRPGQLAHRPARRHPRRRRRDGPRHRGQADLRDDDPAVPRRPSQAGTRVHLSAHRARLRFPRLHRPGGLPHPAGRRRGPRPVRDRLRHRSPPSSTFRSSTGRGRRSHDPDRPGRPSASWAAVPPA